MGEGLQNPDLNLNQLYDQAGQTMPVFAKFGQGFLQYLQDKYPEQFSGVEFQHAPLKDLERIQKKVTGDYDEDHTRVADMVRGRLLVETPEQIQIVRNEITALQESLGIVKVKDFYAEPLETHFRTLNTQVQLPNGHVAEFRIDQHDMAIAGSNSHHLYEEMQAIERVAKAENRPFTDAEAERWQRLIEEQRAIFHDPAQKANLDTLLNENGKAMLEDHRNSRMSGLAETFGKLGKNCGVVAGVAFGTLSGAFTLAAGGSKAEAAEVVYESAVPYGETKLDLVRKDMGAAARSATIETASNAGSVGGALAGAAIGTAIAPGFGTAVGAVVGGLGGGLGSGYITEKLYDNYAAIKSGVVHVAQETAENLSRSVQNTKRFFASLFEDDPAFDIQLAFESLPDTVAPDMPPEVSALVEVKASPELFEQRFGEIEEHGGLPEVLAYIETRSQNTEQDALAPEDRPAHHAHSLTPGLG